MVSVPPALDRIISRYLTGGNAETDDATMRSISAESVRPQRGRGQIPLPSHYASYRTEVRNEEIFRVNLDDDERLEVWRLQTIAKGGETPSEFNARVWDHQRDLQLTSTILDADNNMRAGLDPLGVSSRGADVSVDLTNTTGRQVVGTVVGILTIVDAELVETDLMDPSA